MNCYLVDDEQYAIDALSSYIEKVPDLTIIGTSTNPKAVLEELKNGMKPDLFFLDVNMPELSGIELIDLLPADCAVIFTTGYIKHAFAAFEKNVVDFLYKPFSFTRFVNAVTKVKVLRSCKSPKDVDSRNDKIFINPGIKGKLIQVAIAEISHLQCSNHTIILFLENESMVTNVSVKTMATMLPEDKFVRVHRSFILNIDYISSVESTSIVLLSGAIIPFGESYKASFFNKIRKRVVKNG